MSAKLSKNCMRELKELSCTTAWDALEFMLKGPASCDAYRMMSIKPADFTWKICGPALTVKHVAFDPLNPTLEAEKIKKAYPSKLIEMTNAVKLGDIVVAAALGRRDAGVFGDLICRGLKVKGVAGVVVDGSLRDMPEIRKLFPVFIAGPPTPTIGAYHVHNARASAVLPTEINVPVTCDGVRVRPGDIVIGDECGVMVIPIEYAEDVARVGEAIEDWDQLQRKLTDEGKLIHGQPVTAKTAEKYGMLKQWKILHQLGLPYLE